eukprot:scaffold14306_cov80-Isochrysis_galbana.AAC.5
MRGGGGAGGRPAGATGARAGERAPEPTGREEEPRVVPGQMHAVRTPIAGIAAPAAARARTGHADRVVPSGEQLFGQRLPLERDRRRHLNQGCVPAPSLAAADRRDGRPPLAARRRFCPRLSLRPSFRVGLVVGIRQQPQQPPGLMRAPVDLPHPGGVQNSTHHQIERLRRLVRRQEGVECAELGVAGARDEQREGTQQRSAALQPGRLTELKQEAVQRGAGRAPGGAEPTRLSSIGSASRTKAASASRCAASASSRARICARAPARAGAQRASKPASRAKVHRETEPPLNRRA